MHEAPGRLRVHLPRWSGLGGDRLESELRRLPGVTAARASAATGDVLVCFDVELIDRDTVIERLRGLRVPRARAAPPSARARERRVLRRCRMCWASAGGAGGACGSRFVALIAMIGSARA